MNNLTALPPITNPAWEAYDHGFITEANLLRESQKSDPWGQPMPSTMEAERDGEGDVMQWKGRTRIGKQNVALVILND